MTDEEITNQARSEFDKDVLWQAKDTIDEANRPEQDKSRLTSEDAITKNKEYKKNLISEIVSAGDKLDRIKHLIKRLDLHQVISNDKAQKTNYLLLFLSIVMALQACVYIYEKISNNHINITRFDMLSTNFDWLYLIILVLILLITGYKMFVFGVNRLLGIEREKIKTTSEIDKPDNAKIVKEQTVEITNRVSKFESTVKITFWGACFGGLIIIVLATLILFSSLFKIVCFEKTQSESLIITVPAIQDSSISSEPQSDINIPPQNKN